MAHRDLSPYVIARDVAVVGVVLLALNLGLESNDVGWLQLNPTPWLLLPLLIGAAYGLLPGTLAGLAAAGLIAWFRRGEDASGFVLDHLYGLGSLPLMGFLAGQWKQFQKSRMGELQRENADVTNQLGLARAEVGLQMDSRLKLQRQLALHNVEVANLDEDLRRVLMSAPSEFMKELLQLLHERCRVMSAAIYRCEGERLVQLAALHATPVLKTVLPLAETSMAVKALEERTLAVVRDTLATTAAQPFLLALPWWTEGDRGVLLVQDMPLEAMAWDNLQRMEFILFWVFALSRWRDSVPTAADKRMIPLEDFLVLLGQALQMDATHRLPSTVLKVQVATAGSATAVREMLRQSLPPSAVMTLLKESSAYVALLPFSSQMESEALYRSLMNADGSLQCSLYLTSGTADPMQFWARVLESH
jgi:hypothetical protein